MADNILSLKKVMAESNKSRTTLWRDVRAGTFPAPIQLGPNSIGWFEKEIREWQKGLPRLWQTGAVKAEEEKAENDGTGAELSHPLRRRKGRANARGTGESGRTLENA